MNFLNQALLTAGAELWRHHHHVESNRFKLVFRLMDFKIDISKKHSNQAINSITYSPSVQLILKLLWYCGKSRMNSNDKWNLFQRAVSALCYWLSYFDVEPTFNPTFNGTVFHIRRLLLLHRNVILWYIECRCWRSLSTI